jgi:hypothetical protein
VSALGQSTRSFITAVIGLLGFWKVAGAMMVGSRCGVSTAWFSLDDGSGGGGGGGGVASL